MQYGSFALKNRKKLKENWTEMMRLMTCSAMDLRGGMGGLTSSIAKACESYGDSRLECE